MVVDNIEAARVESSIITLNIRPFSYKDKRRPRLPRKQSKGYDLLSDINNYFSIVFKELNAFSRVNKFKVNIIVSCGKDRLGTADLDNYSKAILDGITFTKKIWNDDKQIDELYIKRVYIGEFTSSILLKIKQIENETNN
jgi:Holliday junction resolvase